MSHVTGPVCGSGMTTVVGRMGIGMSAAAVPRHVLRYALQAESLQASLGVTRSGATSFATPGSPSSSDAGSGSERKHHRKGHHKHRRHHHNAGNASSQRPMALSPLKHSASTPRPELRPPFSPVVAPMPMAGDSGASPLSLGASAPAGSGSRLRSWGSDAAASPGGGYGGGASGGGGSARRLPPLQRGASAPGPSAYDEYGSDGSWSSGSSSSGSDSDGSDTDGSLTGSGSSSGDSDTGDNRDATARPGSGAGEASRPDAKQRQQQRRRRRRRRRRDRRREEAARTPAVDPNFDATGTRVFTAVSSNDTPALAALLASGSNTAYTNAQGMTPLHYAASRGYVEASRLLVKGGANVNATDKGGRSPLLRAAATGKWEIASMLVDHGADPNAASGAGTAALHYWAGTRGRAEALTSLVRAGAHVNARQNDKWTPLHVAAYKANPAAVEALLKAGALHSAPRDGGYMPLHDAATGGCAESCRLLVKRGCRVDALAGDGNSPLLLAATKGNAAAVSALMALGADYAMRNASDETPFDIAKRLDHHRVCARISLDLTLPQRIVLMLRFRPKSMLPRGEAGNALLQDRDSLLWLVRALPMPAFRVMLECVGRLNHLLV